MLFEEFKALFNANYEKFLKINKLKKEIAQSEERCQLANAAIARLSGTGTSYPIIVGNGLSRASIVDLGTFPPYYHNEKFIYPMGFKVKKRFKAHSHYKKSLSNKVLYLCSIGNDGITITADDGYSWRGNDIWEKFKADLGIQSEFISLEDFMVLNNPSVTKMIEDLGDYSKFEGYIPLAQRSGAKE